MKNVNVNVTTNKIIDKNLKSLNINLDKFVLEYINVLKQFNSFVEHTKKYNTDSITDNRGNIFLDDVHILFKGDMFKHFKELYKINNLINIDILKDMLNDFNSLNYVIVLNSILE